MKNFCYIRYNNLKNIKTIQKQLTSPMADFGRDKPLTVQELLKVKEIMEENRTHREQ